MFIIVSIAGQSIFVRHSPVDFLGDFQGRTYVVSAKGGESIGSAADFNDSRGGNLNGSG